MIMKNKSVIFLSDWCNGPGDLNECQTYDCERVSDNCGTLLVYDCDGRCGGYKL